MNFKYITVVLFLFFSFCLQAQDSLKKFAINRTASAPKIDGDLTDAIWQTASPYTDFVQNRPIEGAQPSQKTEVRMMYDDYGIYVSAMLYDNHADSILHELGFKDDEGLNADKFDIRIDPYNTRQDAFIFGVYASGVQYDNKFSDWTFNAVWQSAVKITDKGWCVEMLIPYMAIRFPNVQVQTWAVQFTRDIRRHREFIQWSLTPSKVAVGAKLWGNLVGINNIKPPLRLSLTPYLTFYAERSPFYYSSSNYVFTNQMRLLYGADLKYGLNESFTIDMTLLPDFSQVQSDNKIRNLTYREINYDENRPFFKEGTDLFSKNALFYSRRIGSTPSLFYDVPYLVNPSEKIISNPAQSQLINASKLTGRTEHGLEIGVLNAITNNMYAEIQDTVTGTVREILTEPLTNYSAVVFDQQLKNNSNAYFMNTNVMRNGSAPDANITTAGYWLLNKKNTLATFGDYGFYQKFSPSASGGNTYDNQIGFFYNVGLRKTGGNFQYGIGREVVSPDYIRTDLGFFNERNYKQTVLDFSYNLFQPWKKIRMCNVNLNYVHATNFETGKISESMVENNNFFQFLNFFSTFFGFGFQTQSTFDYFEPRIDGRYYRRTPFYFVYGGFSTDYRKKLAVDMNMNFSNFATYSPNGLPQLVGYGGSISPRYRFNDKFTISASSEYNFDPFNDGFADIDDNGEIIFGGRKLHTYINSIKLRYIIRNDMTITANVRDYWFTAEYQKYYTLGSDGYLFDNTQYNVNNDFSYNYVNVDVVFSWQFLPGSFLTASYRDIIETETPLMYYTFGENFNETIKTPQRQSFTLKLLYFLDYQLLKRRKGKAV